MIRYPEIIIIEKKESKIERKYFRKNLISVIHIELIYICPNNHKTTTQDSFKKKNGESHDNLQFWNSGFLKAFSRNSKGKKKGQKIG